MHDLVGLQIREQGDQGMGERDLGMRKRRGSHGRGGVGRGKEVRSGAGSGSGWDEEGLGGDEGGVEGPEGGGGRGRGDEEVDEERGGELGLVGADVEDPLVVGACAGRGAAFVEASWRASGARFQGAVGVVDAVDCGADVGGQLAWADVPVDDFGDGVAESAG